MFDEIKNKLGQQKAWGTSLVAKEAQAQLIGITHNLLLMYEDALEKRHDIRNGCGLGTTHRQVVADVVHCGV